MSQIIDIVLEHEGQHFQFTAEVTRVDNVEHQALYSSGHGWSVENINLKPLTSIEGIGEHLPDAVHQHQPVELTEADLQARQFYIDCYHRNLDIQMVPSVAQALAFEALTNLREAFKDERS